MTPGEAEVRSRIAALVESVGSDQDRSRELFQYVWSMICVRQGLLRVVREINGTGRTQILLEEVRTGRSRLITRPRDLDSEIEGLAVQALTRILGEVSPRA